MTESVDSKTTDEEKVDKDGAAASPAPEENKETEAEAGPAEEGGEPAGKEGPEEVASEAPEEATAEADETVTEDVWAEALKEAEGEGESDTAPPAPEAQESGPASVDNAKPADFAELKDRGTGSLADMEMILDIPVTVSVELGRSVMIIKDILQLGQGSVVELEKIAGEPMEILVNNRLVARGEVVMVNERFGVRLTDIISPSERVKRLA